MRTRLRLWSLSVLDSDLARFVPREGAADSKRKRAFRRALGFLYQRAASFCRFLVRRFVVFVVSSFVVSSLYRVFYMSSCRSLVRLFGVLSFCRLWIQNRPKPFKIIKQLSKICKNPTQIKQHVILDAFSGSWSARLVPGRSSPKAPNKNTPPFSLF